MAVFETGEFIFADGRNWSYVVDSVVDKVEQKTVDRTAISSAVVQMMRIPFTMETLEIEARYHPNEPGIQDVFREGERIERLDWAISGPGAGGKVDTFKDLILSEGLKKTNTLTDLVKQSVPLHINGVRESDNRFLGYYELRGLTAGTYNLYNGSVTPARVQNFTEGAPREVLDWGADAAAAEALEAFFHIPALSVAYQAAGAGVDLEGYTRAAADPPAANGNLFINADGTEIKFYDTGGGAAGDQTTELDAIVPGDRIHVTDAGGDTVVFEVVTATDVAADVAVLTTRVVRGVLANLGATDAMTIEVRSRLAATGININILQSANGMDGWAAIPMQADPAVPAGMSPGMLGSIHDLGAADTPATYTVGRLAATGGLERYMALQVVVAGATANVSFDVACIMKRG